MLEVADFVDHVQIESLFPRRVERDDDGQVAPDEMIDLAEPSVVRILGLDRVAVAPPPARGDGFGKSKFLENRLVGSMGAARAVTRGVVRCAGRLE